MTNRFRPAKLDKEIKNENLGFQAFYCEGSENLCMMYSGKRSKSDSYYRYQTAQRMHDAINNRIAALQKNVDEKIERKEKMKKLSAEFGASHFFKIGDIIVNSWGYEQTNISFYQVVKMTTKQILVEQIGSEIVEGSYQSHGMACEVLPVKDAFLEDGEKFRLTVKAYSEKNFSLVGGERFFHFTKHDGRPEYKSWYA